MAKGDIVPVSFPFTDLSGSRLRPSVVIVDNPLDVTVCFITSQLRLREPTDKLLSPSSTSGLRTISLVRTSKIATLDKSLLKGLLGKLTTVELSELDVKLKVLLQLP